MKLVFGAALVTLLTASASIASEVEVSCALDLSVEIKDDKGSMEYTSSVSIFNNTEEVFTKFQIQIIDSDRKPIGKTSMSEVLFPGDSETGGSKWSGGQYRVEWDSDPSIRAKQLETFEALRAEKRADLDGASCIITGATKR